jgi:hypothetical protein
MSAQVGPRKQFKILRNIAASVYCCPIAQPPTSKTRHGGWLKAGLANRLRVTRRWTGNERRAVLRRKFALRALDDARRRTSVIV